MHKIKTKGQRIEAKCSMCGDLFVIPEDKEDEIFGALCKAGRKGIIETTLLICDTCIRSVDNMNLFEELIQLKKRVESLEIDIELLRYRTTKRRIS